MLPQAETQYPTVLGPGRRGQRFAFAHNRLWNDGALGSEKELGGEMDHLDLALVMINHNVGVDGSCLGPL